MKFATRTQKTGHSGLEDLFAASGPQTYWLFYLFFIIYRIMEDEKEMLTSAFKSDVSNFALHLLLRGGVKMFLVN